MIERRYPLRVEWKDGTFTRFESEEDHMARAGRCRHAHGHLVMDGQVFTGCWLCLTVPLWVAPP